MAVRERGLSRFSSNLEVLKQGPLDARLVVATHADLLSRDTWVDNEDPRQENERPTYLYDGMIVSVTDEGVAYMLTDKDTYNLASSWKKVGEDLVPEYTIVKLESATSGSYSSYQLQKDGVGIGATIDVPKDMVVDSGTVETVVSENDPYEGAKVGDLYIKLVIANSADVLYIPANKLVDNYTGSTYITVDGREISLNYSALKTQLSTDFDVEGIKGSISSLESGKASTGELSALSTRVDTNATNIAGLATWRDEVSEDVTNIQAIIAGNPDAEDEFEQQGLVSTVLANKEAIAANVNKFNEFKVKDIETAGNIVKLRYKVDEENGITAASGIIEPVLDTTMLQLDLAGGVGTAGGLLSGTNLKIGIDITDGAETPSTIISKTTTIGNAIQTLASQIQAAVAGGITGISGDDYIGVGGTATAKTLSLNMANVATSLVNTGSALQAVDGKIDLYWNEVN